MSLLLEALKRAERAKQAAAAAAGTLPDIADPETPAAEPTVAADEPMALSPLELTVESSPPSPAEAVVETSPEMLSLEPLTEPLPAPVAEEAAAPAPAPAPAPSPLPLEDPQPATKAAPVNMAKTPPKAEAVRRPIEMSTAAPAPPGPNAAQAQAQARKVLAAKQDTTPGKRKLWLLLAGLGLLLVAGGGGYVWLEMQTSSGLATPGLPPAPPLQAEAASTTAVSAGPAEVIATPAVPTEPVATPLMPKPLQEVVKALSVIPPPLPVSRETLPAPVANILARRQDGDPAAASIRITRSSPSLNVLDPNLTRGWNAYQAGQYGQAVDAYRRALVADPTSLDGLLGLAASNSMLGNGREAELYYRRVLELDPKNATALAGVINLRGRADPIASESQVKSLMSQQPDAADLPFALGNLYAGQARWHEAQQAYFKAFTLEPDAPDHAYNLAVALDHLNQLKLAQQYYQKALDLATKRPHRFDREQADRRLQEMREGS